MEDACLVLVRRLRPRLRLAALVETLKSCSPEEAEGYGAELLEILAKHRTSSVVSGTASVFACLSAQAKSAAVCVARGELLAAARDLDMAEPLARRSLAALAAATADPSLAAKLADLLCDQDPGVVADAERAVIGLADALAQARDAADQPAYAGLMEAVGGFDRHRRKGVLLAGLRLLGTPKGLASACEAGASWLDDPAHPAHLALRSLLRRQEAPGIAAAALVWLRVPAQASACRERLLSAATPEEHEGVLRMAHLLSHPARRAAMMGGGSGSVQDRAWNLHLPAYAELSPEARRQTPRWASALPLPPEETGTMLSALAADPAPVVRASLVMHAPTLGVSDLTDLAFDEDGGVARAASVRLALRSAARPAWRRPGAMGLTEGEKTLAKLQRSPHASVRALAWAAAPDEQGPSARVGWRHALRRDQAGTLAELRDRILMGPGSERVRWISTLRVLGEGVCPALERELCDLAEEHAPGSRRADAVLAATAVAALGECPGDRAGEVLWRALRWGDARVMSNAVEAIGRRAAACPEAAGRDESARRLIELKDVPQHRARASALLMWIRLHREEPGVGLVELMLGDARAEHRLAGVWLAERTGVAGRVDPLRLARDVHRLDEDDDERVRERAARCASRLEMVCDGGRER